MTIPASTRSAGPFTGNGVATSFPFAFKVFAKSDVAATKFNAAGVQSTLVLDSHYAVALNADQSAAPGGAITYPLVGSPLAAGETLAVVGGLPYDQTLSLPGGGNFNPTALENQLDRSTVQIQQLAEVSGRTVRVPVGETSVTLPPAALRASKLLGFDSSGAIVGLLPTAGDATSLALDLTSNANPLKGAGQLGYDATFNYAAATVGAKLRQVLCPLDKPWNATGDGVANDTTALCAVLAAAPNGSIIDLAGRTYAVHVGVAGTAGGDAVPLASVPRLFGKSNILIRNGAIIAAVPAVTGSRVRFPSTLVIDGCTDIRLQNVVAVAKGDGYGDADASVGLGAEARRAFLAQNGGHACVVIRSSKTTADSCRFENAGSTSSFYASSSDVVVLNGCYASAMSLGYGAFAADGWCGSAAVSGFPAHRMYLNDCRSDSNGATYGSKGCVLAEDPDTTVWVNGGVFKDAYANGGSKFIGYAFGAVDAACYVNGAQVDNCASIGCTYNSAATTSTLEVANTVGRNLRTSGHISANNPFGTVAVKYINVAMYVNSTSLWPGVAGLSSGSIIANLKQASTITVELINCIGAGPNYLCWNPSGCYGGLRIVGGRYDIFEQMWLSKGWGGSGAGSRRGFEMLAGVNVFLSNAASVTPIIDTNDNDAANALNTYQWIDINDSCVIESATAARQAELIADNSGGLRQERLALNAKLVNCVTVIPRAGVPTTYRVVSLDGIFGPNYRLTVAWPKGYAATGWTFDDTPAVRNILSLQAAPAVAGGELRAQINVAGTTNPWTVGTIYTVAAR